MSIFYLEMAKQRGVPNADINLEYCSDLLELNQFENSKAEATNNLKLFKGNKASIFGNPLMLVSFKQRII